MSDAPGQLTLPLLFVIEGELVSDRQAVVAEKIRTLELVREEHA